VHCPRRGTKFFKKNLDTSKGIGIISHKLLQPVVNMNKNILKFALSTAFALGAVFQAEGAGILLTYAENPGVQTSTLANTSYMDFSSVAPNLDGSLTWAGVGTYDQVAIIPANRYGGADGTGTYLVQSNGIPPGGAVPTTTLTLNTPSAYFGLWWSAGDATNRLTFYNGADVIADFTTASLLSVLPTTYKGNPTTPFLGQNSGENYAFFNVFGQDGSTWDRIVFGNDGGSGFESDNHTTRISAWGSEPGESGPEPGVPVMQVNGSTVSPVAPVPETSSWLMGFLAIASFWFLSRRRSPAIS